jgi:beta-mannosidase
MNERGAGWVDDTDWIYETVFRVDAEHAVPGGVTSLVFHGLDTVAEVRLNGVLVASTDNMFMTYEIDVTDKLVPGDNSIQVLFKSARRIGHERMAAWNAAGNDTADPHWDIWNARSFVRKAQYMFGWDWGPVLISCGLWQPVELVTVPIARIRDWSHSIDLADDDQASVTFTVSIERNPGWKGPLTLSAQLINDEQTITAIGLVEGGVETADVSVTLDIKDPQLWQPNGLGDAKLYPVSLQLTEGPNAACVDRIERRIGLRTIELLYEADEDGKGEGFKFRVNGSDLFIKGANWIPNDSFPARAEVRTRIQQAADCGFNMLRVWGGGLYESEEFYDACDELGILVWQDFLYACAYYPDTGEYADASRLEAVAAVRRLRNRASLALWCGNNENYVMFQSKWNGIQTPRLLGEHLYETILPAVVAEEGPSTPYWPSSPYGGTDSNSDDYGDCHNWDVWHGRGDWKHYTESNTRFCSEFGFGASCGLPAWESCLAPADKHPYSPAVLWHDKTRKGYDVYLAMIHLHYPEIKTLDDLVYYSQINQAEALKFGIEHYRRNKGRCWGTLFWQINDCWPVQSWSIIDSLGDPKAAYYAAKKFYAPVLVSLVNNGATVTAHLVNDKLSTVSGLLTLRVEDFDGNILQTTEATVTADANSADHVAEISIESAQGIERRTFVSAAFVSDDASISVGNLILLAEPKDLTLPASGLDLDVEAEDAGSLTLNVTALRFTPYVWIRRKDNALLTISDNFFHLRPGEARSVTVKKTEELSSADCVKQLLDVRTLQSAGK